MTGASGFVGRKLVARLRAANHDVVPMVRDASQGPTGSVEASLGDPNAIARAAEDCEVVVHTAAETSHRASMRALGWINVAGTENVVAAAKHAGVRRLVHLSCSDVTIIAAPRQSWDEDRTAPGGPISAYGKTKLAAEEIVIGSGGHGAKVDFDTVVLRPAMIWGPGDRTHAARWCKDALAKGLPLFGRGTNLIATTFVENLLDAIERAIEVDDALGSVINVVDGELTLSGDFYGSLSDALGLPAPRKSTFGYRAELALARTRRRIGSAGAWPTDVIRRGQTASFDQRRAKELLGYESRVLVSDGIVALADWVKEQGGVAELATHTRTPTSDDDIAQMVADAS